MIDINELRPAVEAAGLNAISVQEVLELLDRLEEAESVLKGFGTTAQEVECWLERYRCLEREAEELRTRLEVADTESAKKLWGGGARMINTKELRRLAVDCYWPTSPVSINELLDRLEEAESDALEQARLNGMGASREASLMAKLEAAERSDAESVAMYRKARDERDELRVKIEAMERQVPICRAEDLRHAEILLPPLGLMPEDKLYALPGAKALLRVPDAVMAALDSLDDYIARIECNDRGACNHINLLRRYLLDATEVGENK